MKHLDLFSGIGGFALAAQWCWGDRHEVIAFCEQDQWARKVLTKHWPDVPCVEDVRDLTVDSLANLLQNDLHEKTIQRSSEDVRGRNVCSGCGRIFRGNKAVDVDVSKEEGLQVQEQSEVRGGESLSQGDEGVRQGAKSTRVSDKERCCCEKDALRGVRGDGCIQGREDEGSGASSRLQQASGCDVAVPGVPSSVAQEEQSEGFINEKTGGLAEAIGGIDLLTGGFP